MLIRNSLNKKLVSLCGNWLLKKSGLVIYFLIVSLSCPVLAQTEQQPSEYRLKVAFLYNFAAYTEWPSLHTSALNLCIYGEDPFGEHLQHLQQKKVHEHEILIRYIKDIEDLPGCHIVFITHSAVNKLSDIVDLLSGKPVLTIADTPGSSQHGVTINMTVKEGKVIFEANNAIAKRNGLKLSSQLLRFAYEVYQ